MSGEDERPPPELAAALMSAGAMLTPIIEFAEGQRRMLEERGWSRTAAEQYALTVLLALTEKAWRSM